MRYLFSISILLSILTHISWAQDICLSEKLPAYSEMSQIKDNLRKFDIRESCSKSFGPEFKSLVNNSLTKGIACLRKLKLTGSDRIALGLEELMLSKTNIIQCSNDGKESTTGIAEASLNAESNKPDESLFHPFLSLNADAFNLKDPVSKNHLEGTIFHEMIHNMSWGHGGGPEISYTCEACCFDEPSSEKDLACQACGTDYKNGVDGKYVMAIMPWARATYSMYRIFLDKNITDGLLNNPGDPDYLEGLIQLDDKQGVTPDNILTARMLIKEKLLISPEAKKIASMKLPSDILPFNQMIEVMAGAKVELFGKGNAEKAAAVYAQLDTKKLKPFLAEKTTFQSGKLYFSLLDGIQITLKQLEKENKNTDALRKVYLQLLRFDLPP